MPAVRAYVMKGGMWWPLDGGTPQQPPGGGGPPPPPPPPGGSGMLVGASVASGSAGQTFFDQTEVTAGPWTVARRYNSGDLKATWAADAGGADVGKRFSVFSAKPNLTTMANGGFDTAVTSFVTSIPDTHPCALTIWHEPDIKERAGTLDPAVFRAGFARFCQLVRAVGKPHVYTTLILSTFTTVHDPNGKGQPDSFWVGGTTDADRLIDVVTWDSYLTSNTLTSPSHELDAVIAWTAGKGASWGFGEIGGTSNVTNFSTLATWMQTMADYAAVHGAGRHRTCCWLPWFNFAGDPSFVACPGTDPTMLAAAHNISVQYLTPYTSFVL